MTLQEYRLRRFRTIKAFAQAFPCGASKASGILNGHYHMTLSQDEVKHIAQLLGISFVQCADACDETFALLKGYRGEAWKQTARTHKGIWVRWGWEEELLRSTKKAADSGDWTAYREQYAHDYTFDYTSGGKQQQRQQTATPRSPASCFVILGIPATASVGQIKQAFRDRVRAASDGKGGYITDMDKLTLAKEQALAYVGRAGART